MVAPFPSQVRVPWYIWLCLLAVTSSIVGINWDIAWHRSIGRDTFWTPAHVAIYRATNGRLGQRFLGSAAPMLLLDHFGARSGVKRTTPLVYLATGSDLVLVASKSGHPNNPAWYHNLLAHPETTVQVGRERRPVRARVADPAERTRLWPEMVRLLSIFDTYQQRTEREIPLVILEPR